MFTALFIIIGSILHNSFSTHLEIWILLLKRLC
jgi:hypothetical protein